MSGPEDQMYIFCPSEKDARQNKISIANDWKMKLEHNFGLVEVPNLPFGQDNPNTPAILFENKIAPLLNTAIKGVIWYQGESNADRHRQYKDLLQNMVKDWRYHFKNQDMPFIVVQLANYMADTENLDNSETWPLLREAQNDIMKLENTGVAVITDIGEANDIHPLNKKDVGERLAQWALHHTYHLSPLSGSPFLEKAVIHGDKIHLHFTSSAGKLKTINDGPIMGLYISCDQKKFVRAHGEIVGHTVIVWHPYITRPCYVRYAWANNPSSANLVNELGYPVSPFRTDRD
jgi:sialate O-acetylesterase